MRVILAQASGFCGGVRRAMRIALGAAARRGGLRSDGPLVHNRTVVDLLALQGISPLPEKSGLPVLIRAHGVPPEKRRQWLGQKLDLVDATCVHVARNQRLAAAAAARGEAVAIAGDPDHAEVKAVAGAAGPKCRVARSLGDIADLPAAGPTLMLAQTTFDAALFRQMATALKKRNPDSRAVDTICRATHERQEEARRLARRVGAVVVVGGTGSANTRRLAETARAEGKPVFAVETAADLRPGDFRGISVVGVTSGASTPGWITQEVVNRLRTMGGGTLADRARGALVSLVEFRLTPAISAAGLALAAQFLISGGVSPLLALAGAGFVLFAHILHRRVPASAEARRLSLADAFYLRRRRAMRALAWSGCALALACAAAEGVLALTLVSAALAAAAGYAGIVRRADARKSHFPAPARNWAMAAGWALTLAGPPALIAGLPAEGIAAVIFVFSICFGGVLIRDLHDIASDRLMGIATLPSILGVQQARAWAAATLAAAAAVMIISAIIYSCVNTGLTPPSLFAVPLACLPFFGLYLLEALRRGIIRDAVLLQAGVDGMGLLAGIAAAAFYIMA